jgi:OFA family oxalate/formate antiporter-like MFS transporter
MPERQGNTGIFYGWFIVAACFLLALTLGETFWSFGVFFKPLENEFGWSRTVISSGYTAFLIGYAVSAVVSGGLVDRISPRPIVLFSAIVASTGIGLCSQIESVNQLRLFLFIAGMGSGPTWTVASSTVMRWFYGHKRSGLALGATTTGVGFGAILFAPLINFFILDHGWRNAFLYVGIIFVVVLGLAALIIRPSPAVEEPMERDSEKRAAPGLRRILLSPAFLGVTLLISAAMMSFQALSVHLTPHAIDQGVSATSAAVALGLIGAFSIPGRILSGSISGPLGWKRTLALALFGMALSLVWLLFLDATWMLYAFVLCYGICHGVRIPAQLGIVTEFFGMRSLGQLVGITTAIGQLAGAAAPYAAGFAYDRTGSYSIIFLVIMSVLAISGLVALMMKERPPAAEVRLQGI